MSEYENEPQIQARNLFARPGPVPEIRLAGLLETHIPSLIPRDGSSTTSSSSATRTSCGPKDTTGPCERSTSSSDNITLPITLGVIIPLAAAFVVMFIFHRRNVKRQRAEDAEDSRKSLDFGLGPNARKAGRKERNKVPEMSTKDALGMVKKDRGLSMDMMGQTPNPFVLPPGLQHSRESLHSLSRSMNTGDDKYTRTNFIPDDGSIRSPSSLRGHGDDGSSSFTGSSRPRFDHESSRTLVHTSTRSGHTTRKQSVSSSGGPLPEMGIQRKPTAPAKDNLMLPTAVDTRDSFVSTTSGVHAFRKSNDYLGAFIRGASTPADGNDDKQKNESNSNVTEVSPSPPQEKITPPPPAITKEEDYFSQVSVLSGDQRSAQPVGLPSNPRPPPPENVALPQLNFTGLADEKPSPPPEISITEPERSYVPGHGHQSQDYPKHESVQYRQDSYYGQQPDSQNQTRENSYYSQGQYDQQYDYSQYDHLDQYGQHDQHSHHQSQQYDDGEDYYDPAEEYEDYSNYADELGYDPRRLTMGMRPLPPDDPSENPEQRANRIRSFYKEYFDSPNNAQPQQGYYDGSEDYDDYYDAYYQPRGHSSVGGRQRGHTFSNGSFVPGPRAYSSASGRVRGPYGRPGPKKPRKAMPPPKALNILPTPSKLKDDTFLFDHAVDFAPPKNIFYQRSGTPDSLRGGQRPYSPSVKAHIPLASSFDDLSAMPSP